MTGKDVYGDIREHKRTLPVLYAYEHSTPIQQNRLKELYSLPRQLDTDEIQEARDIIDSTAAQAYTGDRIRQYAGAAQKYSEELALSQGAKLFLTGLIDVLAPRKLPLV